MTRGLLLFAGSDARLQDPRRPVEIVAWFLRRYQGRRATQETYAHDLAGWLVYLYSIGADLSEASDVTVEGYIREPLPSGRTPALATMARRRASLARFYRVVVSVGLLTDDPLEPTAARRGAPTHPNGHRGSRQSSEQGLLDAATYGGTAGKYLLASG